jgi:hypothetical protein
LMTQAIRSGDLSCSDTTQSRFRIDPRWTVVNRGDKMVVFSLKRVYFLLLYCFFTKLIQLLFNKLQFLVFKCSIKLRVWWNVFAICCNWKYEQLFKTKFLRKLNYKILFTTIRSS